MIEDEGQISCANLDERWVCIECGFTRYGELLPCPLCDAPEVQQLTIELVAKIKRLVIFDAENHRWSHHKIVQYGRKESGNIGRPDEHISFKE